MENKTFFNVLIGPFIIFSIVYLILAILCYIRLSFLIKSPHALKIGNIFYVNIFLTCLFRCITSALSTYFSIAFQRGSSFINSDDFNIIFLDFLYIPDILIWNCFAFLYCQLIIFFYKGHLQRSYQDFQLLSYRDYFQWNSMHLMILIISFSSLIQVIFTVLASTKTIDFTMFLIQNSVMSLIIPAVLLITEFKLHCTFSGLPYRSSFASENKGRINKRVIYWGFARTLHGIVDILLISYNLEYFSDLIPQSSNYGQFVIGVFILVGEKILTEIVAYLLVFDMDFMTIFFIFPTKNNSSSHPNAHLNEYQENLLENPIEPTSNLKETLSLNENKHYSFSSLDDYQLNNLPRLDIKQISFEKPVFQREKGLGFLRLANKDRIFRLFVREINIKKISKYIMEENFKDLAYLAAIQSEFPEIFVKIKGFDFNVKENTIFLYSEYMPQGSLAARLHEKPEGKPQSFCENVEEKLRFALELAEKLEKCHALDPPLVHGHLTSSNILLDKELRPRLADFSLKSFKKYAGIMINYVNKSQYTAPEYLEDRGNVVQNCRKPADVYSFGVILWEIFTKKRPFQGISLKKLVELVGKERSRPKIPDEIPKEIANIIRVCWQHDEEQRPAFAALVKNMQNLKDFNENEEN